MTKDSIDAQFVIQKTQPGYPGYIKKYSATIRLWHWLNAVAISGSLLTVLLNSTLLKSSSILTRLN